MDPGVLSCRSQVDPASSVPLLQNRTEGSVKPGVDEVPVLVTCTTQLAELGEVENEGNVWRSKGRVHLRVTG